MRIRKDIFSAVGLSEYSKFHSLIIVILFLSAIGTFADSISDIFILGDFKKLYVSIILFIVVFLVYSWLGRKELSFNQVDSSDKEIIILFFPSNLELLQKILKSHKIKKIYFLKTKYFPKEETYKEIIKYLNVKSIESKIYYVNSQNNPLAIKDQFSLIISDIKSLDNSVVNITTGSSISSVLLSEYASYHNIDLEYLSSEYNQYGMPVNGTEKSSKINFKEEFIK